MTWSVYCDGWSLGSFLKSDMSTKIISIQTLSLFSAVLLLSSGFSFAQNAACSPLPADAATPAKAAYQEAKYERAESLYQQALLEKPNDLDLNIALVHTLLHEDRISYAVFCLKKKNNNDPHTAGALTT